MSFDSVAENADFAKKFDYPFPLLCDTKREIGLAYGAADAPVAGFARRITFVISPDGRVGQVHPKVEPKSHPKAILESL